MYWSHLLTAVCLNTLFSRMSDGFDPSFHCAYGEKHYLHQLDKYNENRKQFEPTCFRAQVASNETSCQLDNSDISWKLNNTTGKLDVSFKIYNNIDKYAIELKVANVNETDCSNANFKLFAVHSNRTFNSPVCKTLNECSPTCSQTGSVTFNFVYTDCYRIKLYSDKCDAVFSNNTYHRTDYKKEMIALSDASCKSIYYNKTSQKMTIQVPLVHESWETTSHLFVVDDTTMWGIILYPNKTMTTPDLFNNSVRNHFDACQVVNNSLQCVISNVSKDEVSLCQIINNTDRCKSDTVWMGKKEHRIWCSWKDTCKYRQEWNEIVHVVAAPSHEISPVQAVLIGLTVFLFALAVIKIVHWLWKNREIKPPASTSGPDAQQAVIQVGQQQGQQILLLYARDCSPFMDLMTSFRQLLKKNTQFEVRDCFDGANWDDITQDPGSWMNSLVADINTKVVVVSSTCAFLRQKALLTNTPIGYKDRDAKDVLFLYALQYLNNNLAQNNYKRIFIVRFDGFSDDSFLFKHINEYLRYPLPNHFNTLINSLNGATTSNETIEFENSKELETLKRHLQELKEYVDHNENYLNNVLIETKNV